jgi:ribosomal protein L32
VKLTLKRPGNIIIIGTDNMPGKEKRKANRKEEVDTVQKAKKVPQLQKCPACKEMTLYWDKCTNQGVCLSPGCRLSGR